MKQHPDIVPTAADSDSDSSAAATPASGPLASDIPPFPVPDHTLIRRVGKGSYGEVWLARNALGTWRAVKIIRRSAFDNDRPFEREFAGIQQFEPISRSHESQLNILQVGRAEDGFYYVMEVADEMGRGQDIDPATYTPRDLRSELHLHGRLPAADCLRIGLALTTALEHLHKHGLVHRDIKPSNIVFVNGIPKLADIGLVTRAEATMSFVGTEGFLPPEGPGTRQADIYSLGKVLYELSTGHDRHQFPELPTNIVDLPDRPLLGELNEVLIKACHRDPAQRYQTAAEMHADLALLESGRSVVRMRGMERRLRFVQRAGAIVTALAAIIALGWWWQARQTRTVRGLADEKTKLAETSRQVAQFLKDMLKGVGPSVAVGRDTTMLREILDKTAARVGQDLKDQPEIEAELRTTLGRVYLDLGDCEQGEAMLREALAIRQRLFGEHPSVADSLLDLSAALQTYFFRFETEAVFRSPPAALTAKLTEAESLSRQALEMRRSHLGSEHVDVADALDELCTALYRQHKLPEAEQCGREALALARKLLANDHQIVLTSLNDLAMVLGDVGKLREAEALYREALPHERKRLGETHPKLAALLMNLGQVVMRQDRFAEAETLYREAVAIERKLGRAEPRDLAAYLNALALVLQRQGKLGEAETSLREALAVKIKLHEEEHMDVAAVLDNLGGVLVEQGKLEDAESLLHRSLAMREKLLGNRHALYAMSLGSLAELRERQGRLSDAEGFLRQAVEIERALGSDNRIFIPELPGSSRVVTFLADLARVLLLQGKSTETETALREALDYLRKPVAGGPPPQTPTLGRILAHLADTLLRREAFAETRAVAEEAVGVYRLHPEWPADDRGHAVELFINLLKKREGAEAAANFYREEIAWLRTLPAKEHQEITDLLHDQAALLRQGGKLAEAEAALREALSEWKQSREPEGTLAAAVLHHLADVLRARGNPAQARSFAEEAAAMYQRHADWPLGERQHATEVLRIVVTDLGDSAAVALVCREQLRDARTAVPPDSARLALALARLTQVMLARQEFREAEPFARECLEMRERDQPDNWSTFNAWAMLGGSLLGQKKYNEAEPLLIAGYEGMKQREATISAVGKPRLKEALQRLVQLYEETNRPEKAAEWKRKLAESDLSQVK